MSVYLGTMFFDASMSGTLSRDVVSKSAQGVDLISKFQERVKECICFQFDHMPMSQGLEDIALLFADLTGLNALLGTCSGSLENWHLEVGVASSTHRVTRAR